MKLAIVSVDRFYETAEDWAVPDSYAEVIYNYLVHGLEPGSFFYALLANDMFGAITRSHPSNEISKLGNTMKWINDMKLRGVAWGDYTTIQKWLEMDEKTRREHLELAKVIYTEQEEILKILTA